MSREDSNEYLKLSLQRALLGNVTPNISAVSVELVDNRISIFFYFDGEVSDEDEELVSVVETEVMADFDESFDVEAIIHRLDSLDPIKNANGCLVYLRKE
ncbi:hypothetical protein [Raoultella terrigena]|uniref:hypothetical protein n=1 Tax=Raoultella terrigena TaxID=577 RepID=UPI0005F88718|nr:hypothetical protein [Raoultella terrigena]